MAPSATREGTHRKQGQATVPGKEHTASVPGKERAILDRRAYRERTRDTPQTGRSLLHRKQGQATHRERTRDTPQTGTGYRTRDRKESATPLPYQGHTANRKEQEPAPSLVRYTANRKEQEPAPTPDREGAERETHKSLLHRKLGAGYTANWERAIGGNL